MSIMQEKAWRLLCRQKELAEEILRYYSKYVLFKEKYPENLNSEEMMRYWGKDLWDTYHDFRNNLLDSICIKARILFCEYNGHSHYHRLIDTKTIISPIISSIKQELSNKCNPDEKKLFTEQLLKLAELSMNEFSETKEKVKKYVDKLCVHAEDLFPNQSKEIIIPQLLPIAKLAYGLHRIVLSIKRVEGDDCGININISDISYKSLSELIDYYQTSFKCGWSKLSELI